MFARVTAFRSLLPSEHTMAVCTLRLELPSKPVRHELISYYHTLVLWKLSSLGLITLGPLIHAFQRLISLIHSVSIINASVILEARRALREDSQCTTHEKKKLHIIYSA